MVKQYSKDEFWWIFCSLSLRVFVLCQCDFQQKHAAEMCLKVAESVQSLLESNSDIQNANFFLIQMVSVQSQRAHCWLTNRTDSEHSTLEHTVQYSSYIIQNISDGFYDFVHNNNLTTLQNWSITLSWTLSMQAEINISEETHTSVDFNSV